MPFFERCHICFPLGDRLRSQIAALAQRRLHLMRGRCFLLQLRAKRVNLGDLRLPCGNDLFLRGPFYGQAR